MNDQCRRQLSEDDCEAVADVVMCECRFEATWNNIPDLAMRIVFTKLAEQQIMDEFLANRQTKAFVALDKVQNGTVWQSVGLRITKRLYKNLYEFEVCHLHKNAIVRMIYNERNGTHQFSQRLVTVVVELPEDEADIASLCLRLRLTPLGIHNIDVNNIPAEWSEVTVGTRTTPPSL